MAREPALRGCPSRRDPRALRAPAAAGEALHSLDARSDGVSRRTPAAPNRLRPVAASLLAAGLFLAGERSRIGRRGPDRPGARPRRDPRVRRRRFHHRREDAGGRPPPESRAAEGAGGYSPLTPTVPAQTPVSWATFSTGLDPGGTQIFDFLKRDPANRIPTFAVAEETSAPLLLGRGNPPAAAAAAAAILLLPAIILLAKRRRVAALVLALLGVAAGVGAYRAVRAWVPETRPWVRNNRRGPVFWTEAGARPATVMRMPVTFPPDAFPDGRMMSGLGVPDLSGRIGRPSFYTSDPFFAVREGNDFSVEVVRLESNTGTQTARLAGPPGRAFGKEGTIDIPLTLTVPPSRDRLVVEGEARAPSSRPDSGAPGFRSRSASTRSSRCTATRGCGSRR